MKRKRAIFVFILAVVSAFSAVTVHGADEAAGNPFDLEFHYPENQADSVAGYYDIDLSEGQTQELSVTIKNNRDYDLLLNINPYDCYTHPSGGLYYDKNPATESVAITDKRFMWSDSIKVVRQVVVPAGKFYKLPFTVTVPPIEEGSVIAALNFSTPAKTAPRTVSKQAEEASFAFNVRHSVTVAVKVNTARPAALAKPSVAFGKAEFDAKTCRILYGLENILPVINEGISGNYFVADSKGTVLFEGAFDLDKMAPKSSVKVPVPWEAATLEKGVYKLKVNVNADDKVYPFESTFEITGGDINVYSDSPRAVAVIKPWTSVAKIVTAAAAATALLVLAVLVVFVLIRRRRRNENSTAG